MKKIFNQKIISTFLLAGIFLLTSPEKTLAYNSVSVCQNIINIETTIKKDQEKIRGEVNKSRQKRSSDIKNEWNQRDENFKEERTKADFSYQNFVSILKNKTQTEAEKTAVETFEQKLLEAVKESRTKVDQIWDEYESATLLSLSNQDAQSEKYFKEIESESSTRVKNIHSLCKVPNVLNLKSELENVKKIKTKGLARFSSLRKANLEIEQFAIERNKNINIVQREFIQKITSLYNTLPESLRK